MRKKMYLAAGGPNSRYEDLFSLAVQESGAERPSVAYIGTANGESVPFMHRISASLLAAGCKSPVMVPLLGSKRMSGKAAQILKGSDILFFSGGEVEDGILGIPGGCRELLQELYESGKVFAGISAGTIMLGKAWPHWDDEDNDPETAVLFDCLGFVPTIFDTHCEWEDWVELRKAVSLSPEGFRGYGIPAGGAVIVHEDGSLHPTKPLAVFRNEGGRAVYEGDSEKPVSFDR